MQQNKGFLSRQSDEFLRFWRLGWGLGLTVGFGGALICRRYGVGDTVLLSPLTLLPAQAFLAAGMMAILGATRVLHDRALHGDPRRSPWMLKYRERLLREQACEAKERRQREQAALDAAMQAYADVMNGKRSAYSPKGPIGYDGE